MMSKFKTWPARVMVLALQLGPTIAVAATVISDVNFDSGTLPVPGWSIGAQSGGAVSISTDAALNLNASAGSLRGTYPATSGSTPAWAVYNVSSLNTYDVYIEFWAKMPGTKHGLKFLKIFGGSASGYANTTFALDYTGIDNGSMRQVSFGDGTSLQNDTQNVINFDGTYPQWMGRSYGISSVSTPQRKAWASANWGTNWHHFRIHAKFNSGTSSTTEVNDGEYYVEIDGVIYVDAKGLFNRNYANTPIDRIEFLGWTQSGTQPFEVWYDDVRITTGGFSTAAAIPMAPASLSVQ